MEGEPQPARFDVRVPPDAEAGSYANFVTVWHSPHEFTIDFSATLPPVPGEGELVVPCQVVARLKIAPTLIFDLMQALNDNMGRYEATFGEIRRPGADDGGPE